ncbi:MAG: carboxypeptidase regulatory-like domain-containing protein [Bacteroidales bacterium]|nr:carboxypeptidase regulatory-like domain-containing protein [Bacteroidales bacterium]
MKTTRVFTLFALLLVVTSMTTLTSCKKIPDQVTISGIVTDIDGQPIEGVRIGVFDEHWFSGLGYAGLDWYTDESGYYRVEFEPYRCNGQYWMTFEITKDDGEYYYRCDIDKYNAEQEINVVLLKKEE